MPTVLFNPCIGPYRVLPRRARVDVGEMAMKGYCVFPKAVALLGPHHQTVKCHIQDTRCGGGGGGLVLPLCRGAVSVFHNPSRLDNEPKNNLCKEYIHYLYNIYIQIKFDEVIYLIMISIMSRCQHRFS